MPPPTSRSSSPSRRRATWSLRLKGDGSKKPLLLLAHLDVVEALRNDWQSDPFVLREDDGYFTARGSADDKSMAAAFVSILAQLKREGFKPKRDIILALTADEERGNVPSNGVSWLVRNRRELIDAEFGINEGGGGELRSGKPFLNRMQVAEKMSVSFQLLVRNPGGHSSVPVPENAIYSLAEALTRIGAHRFPVNVGEVTKAYFGRSAQFATGQAAADMRAIGEGKGDAAVYDRLSQASAFYNAQLRTTCVATLLNGGHADNALPQSASATINCRILPHDDAKSVAAEIERLAGSKVDVKQLNPPFVSPPSPLRPDIMAAVEGTHQRHVARRAGGALHEHRRDRQHVPAQHRHSRLRRFRPVHRARRLPRPRPGRARAAGVAVRGAGVPLPAGQAAGAVTQGGRAQAPHQSRISSS